jgi:hypothetical protein
MPDNDVLMDLLGRPEIRTIRKPENLLERGNSDRDNSGGYDLTNPNLHHGAEDIYRTVQSSDQPGSNASNVAVAPSATIGESFESSGLQVGDSGPNATVIANQSAYEGQAFLLDISSHFVAPVAGDALTFS